MFEMTFQETLNICFSVKFLDGFRKKSPVEPLIEVLQEILVLLMKELMIRYLQISQRSY